MEERHHENDTALLRMELDLWSRHGRRHGAPHRRIARFRLETRTRRLDAGGGALPNVARLPGGMLGKLATVRRRALGAPMKCTVQVSLEGNGGYLCIPGVELATAQAMLRTARSHGQRAQLFINLGRPCPEAVQEPSLAPRTQPAR